MPMNLIPVPTWVPSPRAPVGAPLPDPRVAETMQQFLQDQSNRSEHSHQRLNAIAPEGLNGVTQLRTVANLTALAALGPSARTDGGFVYVPALGLYRYRSSGIEEGEHLPPRVVRPADLEVSGNDGGWEWMLRDTNVAYGLAPLNEDGLVATSSLAARDASAPERIAARAVRNGLVHRSAAHYASETVKAHTSFINDNTVTGSPITVEGLKAGDQYEIVYECVAGNRWDAGLPNLGAVVRVRVFETPGGTFYTRSHERERRGWPSQITVTGIGTMTVDGSLSAYLEVRAMSGTIEAVVAEMTRTVKVYRP